MAAVIAICIFGNLWIMTFTAARVKQEIAKSGILPWSMFFATSYRTPYGLYQEWSAKLSNRPIETEDVERAPTAAFALHWFTSVLLIAVTSPISDPRKSYSVLVYIFTYSIILVLGGWVSLGLIMVKVRKQPWHFPWMKVPKEPWHFQSRRRYRPWLSPIHAIVYLLATSFLAITAFVQPARDSPFYNSVTGVPWYVLPAISITGPAWGVLWYYGLRAYGAMREKKLQIIRIPHYEPDFKYPDEYVQHSERIVYWWKNHREDELSNGFDEPQNRAQEPVDIALVSEGAAFGDCGVGAVSGRAERSSYARHIPSHP